MNSGLEMVETKHVSGANVSRAEEKTLLNSFIVQACQKVIKVGGVIAPHWEFVARFISKF